MQPSPHPFLERHPVRPLVSVFFILGQQIAALGILAYPSLLAAAIHPAGIPNTTQRIVLSALSGLTIGVGLTMMFLAWRAAQRKQPLLARAILLVAIWATIAAAAEYAARKETDRIFAPDRLDVAKADLYGWGYRSFRRIQSRHPDTGEIFEERLNAAGWRDREHPAQKKRPRLLLLGGDVVWGAGLPFEQTIAADLHKRLQEQWEIFSMGCRGFSTDQAYLALAHEGIQARPDHVVLLLMMMGDVFQNGRDRAILGNAPKPGFEIENETLVPRPFPGKQPSALRRLFGQSRLCVLLRLRLTRVAENRRPEPAYLPATIDESRYHFHLPPSPETIAGMTAEIFQLCDLEWTPARRREWDLTLALLKAMRDLCEKNGAAFTIYACRQYPEDWNFQPEQIAQWKLKKPSPQRPFHLLREFAQVEGIPYIEEPESLRMAFLLGDYSFRGTPFLTRRGIERIGELIAKHIRALEDDAS